MLRRSGAQPSEKEKGKTLKNIIEHTLDERTRTAVAGDLQNTLADLVAMSLYGKQAHWVVVGPRFREVHLMLDELVETARNGADDVAERAAALGCPPDGTPGRIARETKLFALPSGFLSDTTVLGAITEQLTGLIGRMRERITRVDELDTISGDLLIGLTRALEKHAWMLQATRREMSHRSTHPTTDRGVTIHA
jgi:starvation-inducible DNA-binding protein